MTLVQATKPAVTPGSPSQCFSCSQRGRRSRQAHAWRDFGAICQAKHHAEHVWRMPFCNQTTHTANHRFTPVPLPALPAPYLRAFGRFPEPKPSTCPHTYHQYRGHPDSLSTSVPTARNRRRNYRRNYNERRKHTGTNVRSHNAGYSYACVRQNHAGAA